MLLVCKPVLQDPIRPRGNCFLGYNSFSVLRKVGLSPDGGSITLLLPECHSSEVIFDWSRKFKRAEWKETIDGLDRTSCDSLFQSEVVLGKNEYFNESTRDGRMVNVSESECRELWVMNRLAEWVTWHCRKAVKTFAKKETNERSSCDELRISTLSLCQDCLVSACHLLFLSHTERCE